MTGAQVAAYLRAQGIEPELAGGRHVLLILTYSDGLAEIKRLASVLDGLAKKHSSAELLSPLLEQPPLPQSPAITPREAILAPAREVLLTESGGEISASLVTPYPPGIPILIPGERISPEVAEYLANTNKMGTHLAGVVRSKAGPLIEVVE
jgi:arginine/lysine/ornithine decarboxylase